MSDRLTPAPQQQARGVLDRAREALNARMTKDTLRHVLQNVINYAALLESERKGRVLVPRWEYELMELQRERAAAAEARIAELEAAQLPPAEEDDPNDNRRRLYVDGKGNGWISVCTDEGTEWVVPVQPEAAVEQDVRDVADETGSLREIGRCW